MNSNRRHMLVASGALFTTGVSAHLFKPEAVVSHSIDLEKTIPSRFDSWEIDPTIVPIKPTPDAQAKLNQIYDQIVSRTYKNSTTERAMLSVAYGSQQTDKLKAHRQEVCYAAQGFRVSELTKKPINVNGSVVPVTRFLATLGPRVEPVSYWFTMGNNVVDSRFDRLVTQVRHGFMGEIPDGLLVRISSISNDLEQAYRLHDSFANALIGGIAVADQRRFIGSVV